ncbi:MAG: hypothetical protein QME76_00855 [Bacillota bacterium]|nr:hypothetical protein [Bacillota bacterium]
MRRLCCGVPDGGPGDKHGAHGRQYHLALSSGGVYGLRAVRQVLPHRGNHLHARSGTTAVTA